MKDKGAGEQPVAGRPAGPLIAAMFGRIAGRYDLMNTLMTAGLDRSWRLAAVRAARPPRAGLALDVGTGTGRLASELARAMPDGQVVGLDLTLPMLRAGQAWLWSRAEGARVALVAGDALQLPFEDQRFDVLTTAFTVRNLPDLAAGFREQARVVKPGGRIVCLELTWPRSGAARALLQAYCERALPLLGTLVAGDGEAYRYLPESVRLFPPPARVAELMRAAGIDQVRWAPLGLGMVTLHAGRNS
jgi:demethylmenaquinone methyltransferase/2-methoxy-6-polyprenyl-1,4-benzoquinol methylase